MYFRCPTCGTSFAKRYIEWIKESDKINGNMKLSDKEKDKKRQELLDKLNFKNYCCKMRILTMSNLTRLIK